MLDWHYLTRISLPMLLLNFCARSYSTTNDDRKEIHMHFLENSPNKQLTDSINNAFEKSAFLRFRYAPLGTLEGQIDQQKIDNQWTYSVTQNCFGPCSNVSSAIRDRISTARRIAEQCPFPYQMSFQLLDASKTIIESIAIGLNGMCLTFHDQSYAVAPSHTIGKALMKADFDGIFLIR